MRPKVITDESGVTAVEYGMMASLVALAIMLSVFLIGEVHAAEGGTVAFPQVVVLELVFINDDGMLDADAYVGPKGSTVDGCKEHMNEFVDAWKADHPHALLAEGFCVQHADPAAVLEYLRSHQPAKPQSAPTPRRHVPEDGEA